MNVDVQLYRALNQRASEYFTEPDQPDRQAGLRYALEPLAFFCLAVAYLLMMCLFGLIEATGIQVIKAKDYRSASPRPLRALTTGTLTSAPWQ